MQLELTVRDIVAGIVRILSIFVLTVPGHGVLGVVELLSAVAEGVGVNGDGVTVPYCKGC